MLTAMLALGATAALGMWNAPGAANLPALAVRLGGSVPIAYGLSGILLLGIAATWLARLTAVRASAGQAALPMTLAVAMLMPGAGATAYLGPLTAAAWLWLVERRPGRPHPSAANDDRPRTPLTVVFAPGDHQAEKTSVVARS